MMRFSARRDRISWRVAMAMTSCLVKRVRIGSSPETGDDTIVGDADAADDIYDGGAGIDTLDYSAAKSAVDCRSRRQGIAAGAEIGTDSGRQH